MPHNLCLKQWKWGALLAVVNSLHLILLLGATGCSMQPKFKPVKLDADPGEYASTTWAARCKVHLERTPVSLHCRVNADPAATQDAYGGIMLPAHGCEAWRLELAFFDATDVLVAYVDAYNAKNQRVARWQSTWGEILPSHRAVHTFVPQQNVRGFTSVPSEGKGPIESIHVFVRLKPGTSASFDLFGAELGN